MFLALNKVITPRFSDRAILVVGAFLCVLTSFVMIPWGNKHLHYQSQANSTGCKFEWCDSVPAIQPFQIVLQFIFYSLAFVFLECSIGSLYSKVLGPRRQGLSIGIMVSFGAFGRMVSPLTMTHLFSSYGPRVAYTFQLTLGLMLFLSIILFYNRLVSNVEYQNRKSHQSDVS